MDTGSFTDLLSAAMSESGLIDLETRNEQPAVDTGSHSVANLQPLVGTPTAQKLMTVSVQPPHLRTNSIIVQRPQLQSPAAALRPAAVHSSADTQKGVHKILLRPMPAGLPKPLASRQLQPVVLQSTGDHQPVLRTNVTSGRTPVTVVRPVLPLLPTVAPHTGSSTVIRPLTAASVSSVSIPATAIRPALTVGRPALTAGTLRFTAIPRQLAARLPTGEGSVSFQIRPRLPASTVVLRTEAGSVMQPVGQRVSGQVTLLQTTVPSSTSNLVPINSSSSSTMPVVSVSGSKAASVAQPGASSAARCVSCVAGSVVTTSNVFVPVCVQNTASCVSTDSANRMFVTSTSLNSELSLNVTSQADTGIDSWSAIVSSAAENARCISTTATVTVCASNVYECSSVISSASVHTSASLQQPGAVSSTLTSSENLRATATDLAAKAKSEAEVDDDEQVR